MTGSKPIFYNQDRRGHQGRRGIALYLTIIIIAIVLFVSLAISSLAYRQLRSSGIGLESQQAFYGANAGVECALYLDRKEESSPFPGPGDSPNVNSDDIDCELGETQSVVVSSLPSDGFKTVFSVEFNEIDCPTEVTVTKNNESTTIESRGHGGCDAGGQDPQYERGVRVRY